MHKHFIIAIILNRKYIAIEIDNCDLMIKLYKLGVDVNKVDDKNIPMVAYALKGKDETLKTYLSFPNADLVRSHAEEIINFAKANGVTKKRISLYQSRLF